MDYLILSLQNAKEFDELVHNRDIRIAKSIVKNLLKNLHTNKNNIPVLEVNISDENVTFHIVINRDNFLDVLEKSLKIYIENELYEECSEIHRGINYLKCNT